MLIRPRSVLTARIPALTVVASGTQTLMLIGQIGDQPYALAVSMVERVLPMAALTLLPAMPRGVVGVLNLHGAVLPAVDPRPRLGLPTPAWHPDQRLVVLRMRTRYLLWMDTVDRIVRAPVQQVAPDSAGVEHALVPCLLALDGASIPVLSPQALDPGLIFEHAVAATRV